MNKTTMTFAMAVVLAAVFAVASPMNMAIAQTFDTMPDGEGEGEYKDRERKDGKSCPFKERKAQSQEQSS
ncbi:MAG: hypothetical protein ACRBB2_03345 [Nitrosopumilus sp.]